MTENETPSNENPEMKALPNDEQLLEDESGFHVEENDGKKTVVVTDSDLFGEHLKRKTEELEAKKEDEEELLLQDCVLPPLHLACADVETGNHRLIEIKNNIATATNGHILIKMDLALVTSLTVDMLKKLDGKFIHMSVWQEMSKCESLRVDDDMITVHKSGINKMFDYSDSQGTFFNTNHIVEDLALAGEDKKRMIFLDASLIATIAKIFKTDNLHFSPTKGENKGLFVFPYHGCGMFAILMPLQEDKAETRYYFT